MLSGHEVRVSSLELNGAALSEIIQSFKLLLRDLVTQTNSNTALDTISVLEETSVDHDSRIVTGNQR